MLIDRGKAGLVKALTIVPGKADSARVADVPEPPESDGEVLAESRAVGICVDVGLLNRSIVLQNDVVFGSVNANRRHYEQAADALAHADKRWLGGLITRHVPLEEFADALQRRDDDVKVVLDLAV
jgi:threonine dehydrogenase-like Zn-dependent dehydrogenase